MKRKGLFFLLLVLASSLFSQNKKDITRILTIKMHEEVAPALWRKTQKAFDYAYETKADLIIINLNTYGGLVVSADSIRTRILNSTIPVYAFINNNAASAGALITIACDKIYMRKGANIGAATVVNQSGKQMPDKYQSYMRSTMRATAESHGKDTIIKGKDTTYVWKRNPKIAEAMVDASIAIEGIIDTGKVITFTTMEAQKYGFCEEIADNIQEIIEQEALSPTIIEEYQPKNLDKIIGWLMNPIFQSLLIMVIFGGIYFELQTPGIGFPIAAAVVAATLYFAPLYLEGIANNWEIILFFVGLVLIGIEIFAIPGFGIAGISGIVIAITGLALAMIDKIDFEFTSPLFIAESIFKSLLLIVFSLFASLTISLWLSKRMFQSSFVSKKITLQTNQPTNKGFIGVDSHLRSIVGSLGIAETVLRPSGLVIVNGKSYDAKAEYGFIEKGEKVKVIRSETAQIYVIPIK